MSDQFYVKKAGGIKENGEIVALEGTKEKGPWYHAWQFSDPQIERWLAKGCIEFMDKEVE